ncbi:hypothetical protein B0H11DRAFT_2378904 [Mycena galericulata]|nr:hypothetical protein B0H11DRAFT_2378904 [Mycena galericulata]
MSLSRTVHSRPAPKPVVPAAVQELLATVMPDASAQKRQEAFGEAFNLTGSFEAAVAFVERSRDAVACGAVIGAPFPPANADVKSKDVGPFKIFYHSTRPLQLQEGNLFTWNFYIGRSGRGVDSIMPNWTDHGIVVKIPTLIGGEWGVCPVLTILPSTRVRLCTRASNGTEVIHEIVFPPDPRESSVNIHYL